MSSELLVEKRPSRARERLLATASDLFYREGIHAVGVDRVVVSAAVTRATFYRHFPSKEDLVLAYLAREDADMRAAVARFLAEDTAAGALLEILIQIVADDITVNHTRGCPFINAAAEYPDPQSPVRELIAAHREWTRATLSFALETAGRPDYEDRAGTLVMLRDAAFVGSYLDTPATVRETFVATARAVAGLG